MPLVFAAKANCGAAIEVNGNDVQLTVEIVKFIAVPGGRKRLCEVTMNGFIVKNSAGYRLAEITNEL